MTFSVAHGVLQFVQHISTECLQQAGALGSENTAVSKADTNLCPHGASVLEGRVVIAWWLLGAEKV